MKVLGEVDGQSCGAGREDQGARCKMREKDAAIGHLVILSFLVPKPLLFWYVSNPFLIYFVI